jgi:hypothetical protein
MCEIIYSKAVYEGLSMERNKKIDMTKKLKDLVKNRKTPIVIIKQGTVRVRSRSSSGESLESYSYSSNYENN